MSGLSSEKTINSRISRTSSPQTETARVIAGPAYRCETLIAHRRASCEWVSPPDASAVRRAIVSSLRRISDTTLTATEHQRAMADALHFLEIGREQQNRKPLFQRLLQR